MVKSERKSIGYIFFHFVTPPQNESNYLTDIGKKIKSLNHLVYILKLANYIIAYFALKFPGRKYLKA